MNLSIHESAALFPMLNEAELDELAADIAKHGQLEPIVLFEEKILDGRNRLEACRRAQVKPKFRALEACDSPTAFVISSNLHRRHMTPMLRSTCAVDALPLFAAEARIRQQAAGKLAGRGRPIAVPQTAAELSDARRATDEAAHAFRAGERAVESMAAVRRGAPEVFAAARAGKIVAVTDAVRIAQLDADAQAEVLTAISCGSEPRQAIADHVRAERIERINQISAGNAPVTGALGRFPVIYADPPWRYEHVKTQSRAIENQYPTMDLDAICGLPVRDIATDDAVLFVWATSPKLAEAMRVIEAWGFSYRTCAAWVKNKIGMGYYFRQRHELLLVATRGALPVPHPSNRQDSVVEAPLGEHSAKPAIFAELIERMYPEHKRIELFCRSPRPGWAAWGNQAGGEAA